MATIEKRTTQNNTVVWRVKVRRKGAPPQTATFQRLIDAKKWAQITEGAALEGRHFKTAAAKHHTMAELIDRYVTEVLPAKRPSTVYGQRYQLQWWKVQIGLYCLADVNPALIVKCRDKLTSGRSNATVVRYMAVLSHVFTMAIREWRWLDDSPMRNISRPKEPRGRVRFLSDEERSRLLDACEASRNSSLYIVVVLALSTGARRGELLSLVWPDVDLHRQIITLNDTKNGERRTLPLTGQALLLMQRHAGMRRIDTPLVFPNHTGTKPMNIRDAWENTVRRAQIEDFRFHDLRHSAASYLAMNGASLAEIAEVLGHKTLSMVKRYTHLSESHTRSVVARMNQRIFGES